MGFCVKALKRKKRFSKLQQGALLLHSASSSCDEKTKIFVFKRAKAGKSGVFLLDLMTADQLLHPTNHPTKQMDRKGGQGGCWSGRRAANTHTHRWDIMTGARDKNTNKHQERSETTPQTDRRPGGWVSPRAEY